MFSINPLMYSKLTYDAKKDFVPVARFTVIPAMLVVNPGVPATNVAELVAYIKANPGKVSFASAGNGTTSHLAGIRFAQLTGTDITPSALLVLRIAPSMLARSLPITCFDPLTITCGV